MHGKVNKPGGDLMTSADLQPPTAEETSPGIGWAILRELVRSPTVAFGALAIHPFWIPSLLVCVLLLGAGQGVQYQESLRFGREVQESALQRFDLPEEDVEAAMAALPDPENLTAADYAKGVGQGVLSTLVFGFLGAVLLHLGVKVAGGDPAFGGSLALFFLAWTVSCVGVLAHGLLASLSGTLEVAFSPALIPGVDFHSWTGIFLDLFDVFSLLNLWFLLLGVMAVHGLSRGTARWVCGSYWVFKALLVFSSRAATAWMQGTL